MKLTSVNVVFMLENVVFLNRAACLKEEKQTQWVELCLDASKLDGMIEVLQQARRRYKEALERQEIERVEKQVEQLMRGLDGLSKKQQLKYVLCRLVLRALRQWFSSLKQTGEKSDE